MPIRKKPTNPDIAKAQKEDKHLRKHGQAPKEMKKQWKKDRREEDKKK